jgi:tetratricopeptide (TPR) repeat protein
MWFTARSHELDVTGTTDIASVRFSRSPFTAARLVKSAVVASLVLASGAFSAGCSSSGGSAAADERPHYVEDYTAGNFEAAYAAASRASEDDRLSANDRERAALIAGEAAHAMNRDTEAQTYLYKVAGSQDELVRGKAKATLGLIALDQGNHSRAADFLQDASALLMGDEAARASMFAGDALRAQNKNAAATEAYRKAAELAKNDPELRSDIQDRLAGRGPDVVVSNGGRSLANSTGPFTLQLGAFSSSQKAQSVASQSASAAARAGLGVPTVVRLNRNGKILHAVRIGTFASRTDAQRAAAAFKGSIVTVASAN